jgi:hypothetical protein
LLGAGLVFWGWQTGYLPFAVPMALLLEGARLVRRRWDVTGAVYERLSDFCTLFFAVLVVYAYATKPGTGAIMAIIGWLPFPLYPLAAAQAYSAQGRVDLGAFFWTLRRRAREGGKPITMDLAPVYLAVCVLSASAANVRAPGFYLGMCTLAGWALWRGRERALLFLPLFGAAAVLGYAGHVGLHDLQDIVELRGAELVFGKVQVRMNPFQSDTAIGRIGALKRSDRIVMRVRTRPGEGVPHLLRDGGYDLYRDSKWYAHEAGFKDAASGEADRALSRGSASSERRQGEADRALSRGSASSERRQGEAETSWRFEPGPEDAPTIRIATSLRDGQGMLALPAGAFLVSGLPAGAVSRNRFGAVKVEDGPGFAEIAVRYSPKPPLEGPPRDSDLLIPESEKALFARLASELGLKGRPTSEVRARVSAYFQDGFSYSVYQEAGKVGAKPLEDFLLRHKSGHCEYYATTAVLLLRAAGVPARYATGYSVQEYGDFEKAFIVRQKHAHAWALAYEDGAWRDLDTTPPSWVEAEEAGSAWGRPLRDMLSWGAYRFSRWRWRRSEGGSGKAFLLILLPLAAFVAWRLRVKVTLAKEAREESARAPGKGLDSEFFAVEGALSKRGLGRKSWEPASVWLDRVGAHDLRPLLSLHNRHRFDPAGLSTDEREALRAGAREWLSKARFSA